MSFQPISACRSCGGDRLLPVIDLGEQPLANAYPAVDSDTPEARYPLATVLCRDCALMQLSGTVPPQSLFDDYAYFSSYSTTMVEAMRDLADRLTQQYTLGSGDLVLEVASNDGYLLQHYQARGVPVLGIEPAKNVAEVARAAGIPTICEYFGYGLAQALARDGRQASVLHANNVMAHVPDINDFVAGLAAVLRDDGVAVIETPYVARLVSDREFDTIYHEHVFYYSLTSLAAVARRHGLHVSDVEQIPIHGGSLRVWLSRHPAATGAVADLLAAETATGVDAPGYYADLAHQVDQVRAEAVGLLRSARRAGKRIAAYGAAAKGTVLLNYFGLGRDVIEFVADRSPHKQGRRMPGVGVPIVAAAELLARQPDLVLLLAWNFATEILEQQDSYRKRGGHFIVPLPSPHVI